MFARAAEWAGIAAGVGIWVATLLSHAPSVSGNPDATGPSSFAARLPLSPSDFAVPVSGRVLDHDGHPVPNATVVITRNTPDAQPSQASTTTGDDGRFRVEGLEPGPYSFIATDGHQPFGAKEYVPVFEESPPHVEIVLELEPLEA